MPKQKIHSGKGSEGLGEGRGVLSKDDETNEPFVPGKAKLRVEARQTEDESIAPFDSDEIDVEIVEGKEKETYNLTFGVKQGFGYITVKYTLNGKWHTDGTLDREKTILVDKGSDVTLEPTAKNFLYWNEDPTMNYNPYRFTMRGDYSIFGYFKAAEQGEEQQKPKLTVNVEGEGEVNVIINRDEANPHTATKDSPLNIDVDSGSHIRLIASAHEGHRFDEKWEIDGSTDEELVGSHIEHSGFDGNHSITARFEPYSENEPPSGSKTMVPTSTPPITTPSQETVMLSFKVDEGKGRIEVDLTMDGKTYRGPIEDKIQFLHIKRGTTVYLKAVSDDGYEFVKWRNEKEEDISEPAETSLIAEKTPQSRFAYFRPKTETEQETQVPQPQSTDEGTSVLRELLGQLNESLDKLPEIPKPEG